MTDKNELAEVKEWAESRIKSGHYAATTGRFRLNALTAFEAVLQPEEPRTAVYVLENIDSITNREATISKRSGETPKTYRSRVKGLLTDFVGWKADPTGYKIDRISPKRTQNKDRAGAETVNVPKTSADEPRAWETIRLDGSRVFRFDTADITTMEVGRIAYALLARATDFDPSIGFNLGRKTQSDSGAELAIR